MDTDPKSQAPSEQREPSADRARRRRFTRRDFLRDSAALPPLIAALFAAPVVMSCGDGSSSDSGSSDGDSDGGDDTGDDGGDTGDDGSGGGTADVGGDVSSNHGHEVEITGAELDAGDAVTLTLSGTHTHTLDLSAEQVQSIAAGDTVSETSSTNSGHSHEVTFN
jgi:hypothetical protein